MDNIAITMTVMFIFIMVFFAVNRTGVAVAILSSSIRTMDNIAITMTVMFIFIMVFFAVNRTGVAVAILSSSIRTMDNIAITMTVMFMFIMFFFDLFLRFCNHFFDILYFFTHFN